MLLEVLKFSLDMNITIFYFLLTAIMVIAPITITVIFLFKAVRHILRNNGYDIDELLEYRKNKNRELEEKYPFFQLLPLLMPLVFGLIFVLS